MKKRFKKELYYIFNFLYLLWVFVWLYCVLGDIIRGKFEIINIINAIFLCYGFYYFWNQK